VTKNVRRVGRFDAEIVRAAIASNAPTQIALNHLDYIDFGCRAEHMPSKDVLRFVTGIEAEIGRQVDFLGFGPSSLAVREHLMRKSRFA
jgi:adenylosuccinate synthase